MPSNATPTWPKVNYDAVADVLYVSLAAVRNCYTQRDPCLPNVLHCFNELDDEPCGVLVRGYSAVGPDLLRRRLGLDLDLPVPVARPAQAGSNLAVK